MNSEITLKNNEIKDIMKLIKSLENRENLWQETTRNIIVQNGDFINFLGPLMTARLPIMKYVLIISSKSSNVSNKCSYSKEHL